MGPPHHGPYSEQFDNADKTKKYEGTHRENQRFGKCTEWHENGFMKSEIIYRNGKMNGPATYYSVGDGDLSLTTVYQDDQHHGPYVEYHYDGTTKKEYGEHRNGKRVGEWTKTISSGDLFSTTNWRDGEKHGMDTEYIDYSEGLIRTAIPYKNGKMEGVAEQFYNNADHTTRWKGNFVGGHRDGPWTQWFRDGQIEWQGAYKSHTYADLRIGIWREYNEDGELIKVSKFEDGNLVSEQGNCNQVDVTCSTN